MWEGGIAIARREMTYEQRFEIEERECHIERVGRIWVAN